MLGCSKVHLHLCKVAVYNYLLSPGRNVRGAFSPLFMPCGEMCLQMSGRVFDLRPRVFSVVSAILCMFSTGSL